MLLSRPGLAQDRANDVPGPIDSIQDLQDTARMFFKMADTNNDGLISQKEAVDTGNLLVGGFFFRADANGDGTLTMEEARAARESLFQQQPWLRYVLQNVRPTNAPAPGATGAGTQPSIDRTVQPGEAARTFAANPVQTIGALLDTNRDRRIEATELRQVVQTSVQTLFTIADGNQDNQLSPAELNQAVGEAARTAVQVAFQGADTDRNGGLSIQEFDRALTEPAHAAFRVLDLNNDNQVSLEELDRAQQVIANQILRLRVTPAGNPNLRQSQPATNFSQPGRLPTQRTLPAPAPAPAPGTPSQP
jgi:Ca2+-binding EF-hand superfamily protein